MDELIYFTNRALGKTGHAKAWVYRGCCPKCKKGTMGKPVGKDGKVKIRAKEYVCPECGYTMEKQAYEDTLSCEIKYTCPKCNKAGETSVPFKRKKMKIFDEEEQKDVTGEAVRFSCLSCKETLHIVKKMKA